MALSAALGYAHANGVIHCDVKPGNVMIDRGGNIYLTDFGIARRAESTTTTIAGAGTPHYMAPGAVQSLGIAGHGWTRYESVHASHAPSSQMFCKALTQRNRDRPQ
jgi:serine/threonine protein kinase